MSIVMRILVRGLGLALLFALGACQHKEESAALSPQQGRRVEVLIRSQYDIPFDYQLTLGRKTRSELPGYNNLAVTFSHNGKHVDFSFLLSQDGKRLGRLQESDLTSEPWRAIQIKSQQAQGTPTARVTIIVFNDLECPFCARLYTELFPETLNRYRGLVRIAYRDMPLIGGHPWALHAAVNPAVWPSRIRRHIGIMWARSTHTTRISAERRCVCRRLCKSSIR
jgi:Thioredoxin